MPTKDEKAKKIISDFTNQLLMLNDAKKIPSHWSILLKKGLTPITGSQGRKLNSARAEKIVSEIIENYDAIKQGRTKHNSPKEIKNRIAQDNGVDIRTVDRYIADVDLYLNQNDLSSDDMKRAIVNGISEKIFNDVIKDM